MVYYALIATLRLWLENIVQPNNKQDPTFQPYDEPAQSSGVPRPTQDVPQVQPTPQFSQPEPVVFAPSQPQATFPAATPPLEPQPTAPTQLQTPPQAAPQQPYMPANANVPPTPAQQPPIQTNPNPSPLFSPYSAASSTGGGKRGKKKLFAIGGATLTILLLTSGFVFGYYLPNKPDNVWKTGLSRTGKAVDKLVVGATEEKKLESYKKSEMMATIEASSKDFNYSGSFTTKFDSTKADGGLRVTLNEAGKPAGDVRLDFLSELPEQSQLPNIYFKYAGLKTLGIDTLMPELTAYENKWIAVEEAYLKSIGATTSTKEEVEKEQITSADVAEFARAVSSVTSEYVLSGKTDKAIFRQKSFVGKEKVDSLDVYHYKVGVDKEHAKQYCKALIEKIYATNAIKKVPGVDKDNPTKEKDPAISDCQKSVDEGLKEEDEFDMWIDAKYKLIHKVRFTDTENKKTYIDLGQTYKGGDNFSLFVTYHDDDGQTDVNLALDTSIKSNATKGTITVKGGKEERYEVKVTLEAKPYSGDIKIEKPAGAIPIKEVLDKLGVDPGALTVSDIPDSANAEDSGSQEDANFLQLR